MQLIKWTPIITWLDSYARLGLTPKSNYMNSSDWLNAQLSDDMLGTHPKGGHSASKLE